jgi:hypothetical protein
MGSTGDNLTSISAYRIDSVSPAGLGLQKTRPVTKKEYQAASCSSYAICGMLILQLDGLSFVRLEILRWPIDHAVPAHKDRIVSGGD